MPEVDAVVLGDGLNALGVLRSLGKHAIGIALVSRSARAIPAYSRYVKRHIVIDNDDCQAQFVLEKVGVAPQKAMLFLTEEADVAACLRSADSWKTAFRTYFHTPDIALKLTRKSDFDRLARIHGAPVPKTVIIDDSSSHSVLDTLRYPVVVKPSFRDIEFDDQFRKAYKVESRQALVELLGRLREAGVKLVVQEWIEGADTDIFFNFVYIDEEDRLCGSFVGQKVFCWPPNVGGTASCLAAPQQHDELTSITVDLLRDIGFRGLLGMEYKRNARDGRFYVIEPTVYRTDYQHEIAGLSGLEFLPGIYNRCKGRKGSFLTPYERKNYWVDFPASRYSSAAQNNGIQPIQGVNRIDAYLRTYDLMPGLVHYSRYVLARLRSKILGPFGRAGSKSEIASNV